MGFVYNNSSVNHSSTTPPTCFRGRIDFGSSWLFHKRKSVCHGQNQVSEQLLSTEGFGGEQKVGVGCRSTRILNGLSYRLFRMESKGCRQPTSLNSEILPQSNPDPIWLAKEVATLFSSSSKRRPYPLPRPIRPWLSTYCLSRSL